MARHDNDEGPSSEDIYRFGHDTGYCPECGAEVWDQAPYCPECSEYIEGQALPRPKQSDEAQHRFRNLIIFLVMAGFLISLLIGAFRLAFPSMR